MKKEIQLISDFNLSLFYNYLSNKIDNKKYKLNKPNYELFVSSCYKTINSTKQNHLIFVWNTPEETIKEFSNLINCENFSRTRLKKEINKYTDLLIELSKKTDHLLVTSWTLPFLHRGEYLKDLTSENNNEVFVFNGWMFSSSPSITPFDHPVYDIWLVKCY